MHGGAPVLYVVGARPNFIKMAPVLAALRRRLPRGRHVLVHTGQHYDQLMSEVFLEQLGLLAPDYMLDVGSGTHATQTARAMERLEPVLEREQPQLVIVPGDVNSTLAATLVAAKLQIPLAHLEAGLRSFDRTMPEEINRIVADQFANHLFVHCQEAIDNLHAEGIGDDRIHFVGNTMIDSLGLSAGGYVLVTIHRPALVDGPALAEVFAQLDALARELPVVFPVHPRTRKMLPTRPHPDGLRLIEPVGYLEFLSLELDAAAVLTDSGGVQEETTYLGVPCFTLRDNTERPVTIRAGTNTLLGLAPERIGKISAAISSNAPRPPGPPPPPGWDGRAAERVADVLCRVLPAVTSPHCPRV